MHTADTALTLIYFTWQHSRHMYCCDCESGALIKNSGGCCPRLNVVCLLNVTKHSRSSKPRINRRLFALTYHTSVLRSWGTVVLCLRFETITPGVRHGASLGLTFLFNVNVRLIHHAQRLPVDKLVVYSLAFRVTLTPQRTMAKDVIERKYKY